MSDIRGKMSTTKGTEEINERGAIETKVETVDNRSPPGKDKEPTKEDVHVVHLHRKERKPGILAGAAAKVSNTFKSAKNAVLGSGKDRERAPPPPHE